MFKILQIIIFSGLLYGCGFHLAGSGSFSNELSNTHIKSASASKEMINHLEKSLRASKINVVNADNATALLRIINEETQKEVISVDSDGKAREFELFLLVTFDVRGSENTALLDKQVIKINRNFVFDKNNLLGANEEERELFNEMRKDAAKLIVYRLQTI